MQGMSTGTDLPPTIPARAAASLSRVPAEVRREGGSPAARIAVAALALVLNIGFFLPSLPEGTPGVGIPGMDKLWHLLVMALTVWAIGRLLAPRRRFPIGWVAIAVVLEAALVEILQGALMPGRSADPLDLLAGVVGVGVGVAAWSLERRRAQGRRRAAEDEPELAVDGPRA